MGGGQFSIIVFWPPGHFSTRVNILSDTASSSHKWVADHKTGPRVVETAKTNSGFNAPNFSHNSGMRQGREKTKGKIYMGQITCPISTYSWSTPCHTPRCLAQGYLAPGTSSILSSSVALKYPFYHIPIPYYHPQTGQVCTRVDGTKHTNF